MKNNKLNHKKLRYTYVKTTVFTLFCCMFFLKGYVTFEHSGENYFHIFLNGAQVGTVGDAAVAENLLITARKNIAAESTELTFMDAELTMEGEEVLWGAVDSEETLLAGMETALRNSIRETMQRSYSIKVNEYMVNLSSEEEVTALLQAAVDKYDTEHDFRVELVHDSDREFNVLTATVHNVSDRKEDSAAQNNMEAGIQSLLSTWGEDTAEVVEKDFEDYELGILSMNFAEEVEIVEAYLPQNQITALDIAIEEVTKEQETPSEYEVVAGDTLSEIAIKVNIPMDSIIAMNETLEDENSTIRVGDKLVITVPEPELSVERVEENYYEESYNADIIYVDNDNWFTNQTQVLQQPSAGFRKTVANVTFLNDEEVSREILKEEIVMEAVAMIVERGTKIPPTYIKPISGGRLTSGFGNRAAPIRGAGNNHKGIDWAVPTGTAVFASCGGSVARAGWSSSYGYVVYINHADGRQTRYAHLSSVLVNVGETVAQGERIALSGNTGQSTGPHLHFEILINGSQVNPLNYLN